MTNQLSNLISFFLRNKKTIVQYILGVSILSIVCWSLFYRVVVPQFIEKPVYTACYKAQQDFNNNNVFYLYDKNENGSKN